MSDEGSLSRPVEIDGVRFENELEARWAVFLTALGVDYEYRSIYWQYIENQVDYFPSFFIPAQKLFIDVKPEINANTTNFDRFEYEADLKSIAISMHKEGRNEFSWAIVFGNPSPETVAVQLTPDSKSIRGAYGHIVFTDHYVGRDDREFHLELLPYPEGMTSRSNRTQIKNIYRAATRSPLMRRAYDHANKAQFIDLHE